MRRRTFLSLLGGAMALRPQAVRVQPKLPTIGYFGTPTAATWAPWTAAFVQRLRELNWIEGRTVTIEYRWADGRRDRYAALAADLVQRKVDVILTAGSAVPVLKQATATIPIVFAIGRDPVGEGYAASLARPGGNATGLSLLIADLAGKRVELLRENCPASAGSRSWPMPPIRKASWSGGRSMLRPPR